MCFLCRLSSTTDHCYIIKLDFFTAGDEKNGEKKSKITKVYEKANWAILLEKSGKKSVQTINSKFACVDRKSPEIANQFTESETVESSDFVSKFFTFSTEVDI